MTQAAAETRVGDRVHDLDQPLRAGREDGDRGDVSPAALASNPSATGPQISMQEAQQAGDESRGHPTLRPHLRHRAREQGDGDQDNVFAPQINAYLDAGNQFTSYYATGNPSEPNRVAIAAGDDFGITDDNAWNVRRQTANLPEETAAGGHAALHQPDQSQHQEPAESLTAMSRRPA